MGIQIGIAVSKKNAKLLRHGCVEIRLIFARGPDIWFRIGMSQKYKVTGLRQWVEGSFLAQLHPVEADIASPVPDSVVYAALGLSRCCRLQYEQAFVRDHVQKGKGYSYTSR